MPNICIYQGRGGYLNMQFKNLKKKEKETYENHIHQPQYPPILSLPHLPPLYHELVNRITNKLTSRFVTVPTIPSAIVVGTVAPCRSPGCAPNQTGANQIVARKVTRMTSRLLHAAAQNEYRSSR